MFNSIQIGLLENSDGGPVKRAVSVSLGSSKRDKSVEVTLLGTPVVIERCGTDGDMEKAALLFKDLDGKVDAFGVGGADLGIMVDGRWYPIRSVAPMIRYVEQTPIVDGTGLKNTLEYQVGAFLEAQVSDYLDHIGRRAMFTAGTDRWGLSMAFVDQGYDFIFADLMFGLNIPIPLRNVGFIKWAVRYVLPIVGRFPFKWLYPTGKKQESRDPKWEKYYQWATVIAGDRHYIVRHMPKSLSGKIVVTNTTTTDDVELFREAGIKYLVTTTPVLGGRSFGTNLMEAALVAAADKGRKLSHPELKDILESLHIEPQIQELN